MKKSLVLIGLLLVLGSFFASALMTRTDSDSLATKVDYDIEVNIQKGWNLVAGWPLLGDGKEDVIREDSDIKVSDIKASYIYNPVEMNYARIFPDTDNLAVSKVMELGIYSAQSPVWIYSDKTGVLKYKREDFPKFDSSTQLTLTAGWNFVTITPEMTIDINSASSEQEEKYTLNAMKGTCTYSAVYWYGTEGGKTGWVDLLNNPNFMNEESLDSSLAGIGLLIKVPSDCQLGSSSSNINPPTLPAGSSSVCTDSDGGTVIDVKGTTSWGASGLGVDVCSPDGRLDEYFCHDDGIGGSSLFDCSERGFSSCSDGRCV